MCLIKIKVFEIYVYLHDNKTFFIFYLQVGHILLRSGEIDHLESLRSN